MPDPAKRAAWILINDPEEIDAIEKEDAERRESEILPRRGRGTGEAGGGGPEQSADGETTGQPTPPQRPVPRIINMNDPDAYQRLCPREERPWIPAGSLPREPRWPRGESPVQISGGCEEEAQQAFKEWQDHVDAGRVGKKRKS